MNPSSELPPTSEEKLMGALAHFFGMLAALIVWALQKDKSRFVKFQALQALLFDFTVATLFGILFGCLFLLAMLGMSGSMFFFMSKASSSSDIVPLFFLPFLFQSTVFACIFPISLILTVIRLVAALSVLNGREFRYPVLGRWLENFLAR